MSKPPESEIGELAAVGVRAALRKTTENTANIVISAILEFFHGALYMSLRPEVQQLSDEIFVALDAQNVAIQNMRRALGSGDLKQIRGAAEAMEVANARVSELSARTKTVDFSNE